MTPSKFLLMPLVAATTLLMVGTSAFAAGGAFGATPYPPSAGNPGAAGGTYSVTPHSSIEKPGDAGLRAHTHFRMMEPSGGRTTFQVTNSTNVGTAPITGYAFETPASLACVYQLVSVVTGCDPNQVTTVMTGGSKAIALVDAYHYPNALSDLQTFSNQFGLPSPNLQVVFASGSEPAVDPLGWEMEEALDVQWAHALAPNAQLFLVEAASNSDADLLAAVDKASALVAAAGGGQVSMSWGGAEWNTEQGYDSHFQTPGVTYFASSGDSAGTSWPCASPYVVCVGGTSIRRASASLNHALIGEVAWAFTGGGISPYVPRPNYQNGFATRVGTQRGVPDVSMASDTGGWVYYTPADAADSGKAGWWSVYGTSWASPSFAAMVNSAGTFEQSSAKLLSKFYSKIYPLPLTDIKTGWCGAYYSLDATSAWDQCTGMGSR